MAVAHQLGRASGAPGVKVSGGIVRRNLAATGQVIAREGTDQPLKTHHARHLCHRTGEHIDLNNRLQTGHQGANALHFGPNVRSRRGPQCDQHLGVGGLQDFSKLLRFQQSIHRVGNASGLGTEQRVEALWHQRQHQADHLIRPHTQRREQVGGLGNSPEKLTMADDQRQVGGVGILQKLKCRRRGIVRCAQAQRLIGAGSCNPLYERHGLQRHHVHRCGQ